MSILNKLKIFIKKPGQYFRYRNKYLRNLYFNFSKFMHFRTYFSRVYKKNVPTFITDESQLMKKNEGFKLIKVAKLNENKTNIKEVLDKIVNDLKKTDLKKFNSSEEGIIKLKTSKDFDNKSPEFKFVTDRYLVEIVSRYLKCIPILSSLSLWYSPNNKFIENSSQEYHLDHEDYRQVKGFLFINDVDLNTGPLNVINVTDSNNIQKLINYKMIESSKRVNDKVIEDLKKKTNINENILTGKSGDLVLCDTSSCFHYGSRLGNNPKPRLILAFQYVTPFSFSMDWNWKNSDIPFKNFNFEINPLVKKVIGNQI